MCLHVSGMGFELNGRINTKQKSLVVNYINPNADARLSKMLPLRHENCLNYTLY